MQTAGGSISSIWTGVQIVEAGVKQSFFSLQYYVMLYCSTVAC